MRKIFTKWWFKPLIIGIVIRFILMPITLHADLLGHSFSTYFFAYEGKVNIYEHLLSLPQSHPLVRNFGVSDIFIYPPLTYFTLGIFRVLIKPFSDPTLLPYLMRYSWETYPRAQFMWHLFLFKLPYLFIDISMAFLLSKLFSQEKNKKVAFSLWIFNPVTLYATFMQGQFDIIPTLFTLLSLYFARKKKYSEAALALGIGGSYKMYPLFLLPAAAFVFGEKFKEKIKYLVIGITPFLATILPFLNSAAFRQMVLFSPKNQKMLFMNWAVTAAEGLYPYIVVLVLIYLFCYYLSRRLDLNYVYLAILLLFFSVTHYHPQWFLWVTPFLVVELVENKFRNLILFVIFIASWLILTLFFDSSLHVGLFQVVIKDLGNAPSLVEILANYFDPNQIKSIIRSVFAGASLFYILQKSYTSK